MEGMRKCALALRDYGNFRRGLVEVVADLTIALRKLDEEILNYESQIED
jgi:hypothetical protein